MTDPVTYVRGKVAEASKLRGRINQIARDTETDQRTVRALLDITHAPHVTTLTKLAAYFRKEARKAAAKGEHP